MAARDQTKAERDHANQSGRTSADEERPVRFERIKQLRAHEYVAEQIRRHIALGLILPGEALPAERELAAMFGVGRPTVQHALRLLEADHLVGARRGRYGGTFVLDSDDDEVLVVERLMQLLREQDEIEQILVYRRCLEPEVAALAAKTRYVKDVRAMRRATRAMKEAETEADYMRNDTELHLLIADATRNKFIRQQIEEIRFRLNNVTSLLPESDRWHSRIDEEHDAIIDCIEARDGDGARELMDVHIAHSERAVRAALKALASTRRRLKV